jgi:ABC-type sugar transport system ATPase subunit
MGELVEIVNVSKRYPGVKALEDVSFDIRQGEVHALVGENGAGKTTLIKILAGIIQPDSGVVYISGEPQSFHNPLESLRKGVAITYQELGLFPNLSVAENQYQLRKQNEAALKQQSLGETARAA